MSDAWIWIPIAWAYVSVGVAVAAYTDDTAPASASRAEKSRAAIVVGVFWPIVVPAFLFYLGLRKIGGGK